MLTNSVGKDTFYLLLLGRYKLSYKGQWFGLRGTPSTVWVSLIVLKSCLLKAQSDHAYVSVYETALFLSLLSSEAGEDSHAEKSIGKTRGWRSCLSGLPSPAHLPTRRRPHGLYKRTRYGRLGQSLCPAARRPWTVSLPQERSRDAFFLGETA